MNCLICVGVAERIQGHGPWEERDCPDCGRYRVSDELILTLMEQGQIFDVAKTRGWLDSRRICANRDLSGTPLKRSNSYSKPSS